jgi:hypothetical protein
LLLHLGFAQIGPAQIRRAQIGFIEHRAFELRLRQRRVLQVGLVEIGVGQIGAGEFRPHQARAVQDGALQVGAGQISLRQVAPLQGGPLQRAVGARLAAAGDKSVRGLRPRRVTGQTEAERQQRRCREPQTMMPDHGCFHRSRIMTCFPAGTRAAPDNAGKVVIVQVWRI